MKYVQHLPCACCENPDTSVMIGARGSKNPIWLCFACYSTTPHAVGLALDNNKAITRIDDIEHELQSHQAMAANERGASGGHGPDVEGAA